MSVEATNRCNLNCPFCLVGLQSAGKGVAHTAMPRPLGEMSVGLYRKIVQDAKSFGIEDVRLHFQGEPLLNRNLPEMVRETRCLGLGAQVWTNGTLLNEERLLQLLDAGVTTIRFSVDGASAETYAANRVGGDFNVVMANMARTTATIRVQGLGVRSIWQFIVMRNNEHELPRARELAAQMGIEFMAKPFAPSVPELVPVGMAHRRQMTLKPCTDIYSAIFVYWNGDVVVCCYDQAGENVIGNLAGGSLDDIWQGSAARSLRRRIDRAVPAPASEPNMCRSCLKWSHYPWRTTDGRIAWEPGDGDEDREV